MTRSRATKLLRKLILAKASKVISNSNQTKGSCLLLQQSSSNGKVADYSTDGKRVALITLYNSQFFVSLVEDVRKLTPAESKKKRPALRREATLDSMEYNILNDRY